MKVNGFNIVNSSNKVTGNYYFSDEFEIDEAALNEAGYEFRYVDGIKGLKMIEFLENNDKVYDMMSIIRFLYITKDLNSGKDIRFNNQ